MTDRQISNLGPAFSAYLRPYHAFCNQDRPAPHRDAYCRALLTDGPRKTAEPNALASGTAVHTLQKFLTTTRWDHLALRDQFPRGGGCAGRFVAVGGHGVASRQSDEGPALSVESRDAAGPGVAGGGEGGAGERPDDVVGGGVE